MDRKDIKDRVSDFNDRILSLRKYERKSLEEHKDWLAIEADLDKFIEDNQVTAEELILIATSGAGEMLQMTCNGIRLAKETK